MPHTQNHAYFCKPKDGCKPYVNAVSCMITDVATMYLKKDIDGKNIAHYGENAERFFHFLLDKYPDLVQNPPYLGRGIVNHAIADEAFHGSKEFILLWCHLWRDTAGYLPLIREIKERSGAGPKLSASGMKGLSHVLVEDYVNRFLLEENPWISEAIELSIMENSGEKWRRMAESLSFFGLDDSQVSEITGDPHIVLCENHNGWRKDVYDEKQEAGRERVIRVVDSIQRAMRKNGIDVTEWMERLRDEINEETEDALARLYEEHDQKGYPTCPVPLKTAGGTCL